MFRGRSASIRSRRETTPVSGLTCLRKRATVARGETARYPPLVMTSLPPAPSSTGAGARPRVAQLLAAAGRTLRAGRHVMPHDGRAQQVEADDVIAQVRAKVGGDRFRDLDGRKLDGALSEQCRGRAAKRRRGGPVCGRGSALTSRLRFIRSARQVQQALLRPPGLNTGPTSGKMPEGWTSSQGVRSDRCCRFNSASRASR